MHRSASLGILGTALLAIAIVLITASLFLPGPAAITSTSPDTEQIVRQFYTAANSAIATGDLTPLNAIVAEHFVDREPPPGMPEGREGLADYLLALHAVNPRIRLEAEQIVATDERAVAVLTIRGAQQRHALAGAILTSDLPWGSVEVFHIARGKIVERWSRSAGLTLVRPLAQQTFDLPVPAPRQISLARVHVDAGARWPLNPPGPRVLYLERGVLRVDSGAPVESSSLSAGQSMLLAPDSSVVLMNAGAEPADLLVIAFDEPRRPGGAQTSASPLPHGITSHLLAGDLATEVRGGQMTLTLGKVTMAHQARLAISSVEGPTLVALDRGESHVTSWGRVWFRRGSDGMSISSAEETLEAGDGIFLHPMSHVSIQTGEIPITAIVVALR